MGLSIVENKNALDLEGLLLKVLTPVTVDVEPPIRLITLKHK